MCRPSSLFFGGLIAVSVVLPGPRSAWADAPRIRGYVKTYVVASDPPSAGPDAPAAVDWSVTTPLRLKASPR